MRRHWWKILCIVLLLYNCIAGLLVKLPEVTAFETSNLYESMRNFFFHVPMWFSQFSLLTVSLVYSIKYLRNHTLVNDLNADEFARTGVLMGCLGLLTGMIWAKYTWGAWWSNDPKQTGAAIAVLIYLPISCCAIPLLIWIKGPAWQRCIIFSLISCTYP
jgi:heme exporter protein C